MALQIIIQQKSAKKRSLESFAVKLLEKIINAPSESAIERFIGVAVKALGNNKINGYIIQRFIDRVTYHLDNHLAENALQKANTVIARQRLRQLHQQIASPAGNA